MSIENDIRTMVCRLEQADIQTINLCYLVDEQEWQELCAYVEARAPSTPDLSYVDSTRLYGMEVRKRTILGTQP